MKNHVHRFLLFVLTVGLLSSCALSKRHHQPGFYFSWNHFSFPTKEISSPMTIPIISNLKSENSTRVIEEKQGLTPNDTIPPQSPKATQITSEPIKKAEISKEEIMKIEAKNIQTIHHIKQLVTAGGLFGVLFGSFYFATGYTVMYPFLAVMLLIALFAGITALFGFIVTVKVKKFKKHYPEFSESPEYKKALKTRKRARLSLYFSYVLLALSALLALFAALLEVLTIY